MTDKYAQKHGALALALPKTRNCKVVYQRDGSTTNYGKVIPTPQTRDALQVALLAHGIALRQVQRVEAIR